MPLNMTQAIDVVHQEFPDGRIQKAVDYDGLYLFQIFTGDSDEGQVDPFYSVDQETGEFKDFSIITDGDISRIASLFEAAEPMT